MKYEPSGDTIMSTTTRLTPSDVSAEDFALGDASIDDILCRHIKQEYDLTDPA